MSCLSLRHDCVTRNERNQRQFCLTKDFQLNFYTNRSSNRIKVSKYFDFVALCFKGRLTKSFCKLIPKMSHFMLKIVKKSFPLKLICNKETAEKSFYVMHVIYLPLVAWTINFERFTEFKNLEEFLRYKFNH